MHEEVGVARSMKLGQCQREDGLAAELRKQPGRGILPFLSSVDGDLVDWNSLIALRWETLGAFR